MEREKERKGVGFYIAPTSPAAAACHHVLWAPFGAASYLGKSPTTEDAATWPTQFSSL